MPASFASGSSFRHSKNSVASNSLLAALPAPRAACAGISRYAAFPHTHNPHPAPARQDLHQISKALGKNWRHSESFDTKNLPPSLWSVKETKNPLGSSIQAF